MRLVAAVVDQKNLFEQLRRRLVKHAVDGAQQGGHCLVVKHKDD